MKPLRIFAINPGSTSTKIGLFENDACIFSSAVSHDAATLQRFQDISEQLPYRRETILEEVQKKGISLAGMDAFTGRGGGMVSLEGGTYPVNAPMLEHVRSGRFVNHPACLGPQLAYEFAKVYGGQAFTINPADVDEFDELARYTGLKGVYRQSKTHALNQKEVALRVASMLHKSINEINLIVAHIGGGVSIMAHKRGRMVDGNDIVHGDGPMAPTRCGAIPMVEVVKLCFSGKLSQKEIMEKMTKTGGLLDHLGTMDARDISRRIDAGDTYAKRIYDCMIYQIAKSIGGAAAVLNGDVLRIVLTGGLSNDIYLTDGISERVSFIAPVMIMPGEFELQALAAGAYRVLLGIEQAKEYSGIPIWEASSF